MKELIITNEDINLLKEMKDNCLKASIYEDEKRLLKANAITKFLVEHEENKQLKEKLDCDLKWAFKCDELTKENQKLQEQLQQKEDIINKAKNLILPLKTEAPYNAIAETFKKELSEILDNKGE